MSKDNKKMSRKDFLKKTGIGALALGALMSNPVSVLAAPSIDDILAGKVTTTHEHDGNTGVTDNLKTEGFIYSDVAPGNTHAGWVDTANKNVLKYYDQEKGVWVAYGSVWRDAVAPSDTRQIWVDTEHNDAIRFWNGEEWHFAEYVQVYNEAPANTAAIWIDTSQGGIIKYHDGTDWKIAAAGSWISDETPPSTAMTWIKGDGRMYYFDKKTEKWQPVLATVSGSASETNDKRTDNVDGEIFIDEYGRVNYRRNGAWHLASAIWS